MRKSTLKVLPQYRPRPDGDRLKKKEKYDEALRFIQELMDCDEFEDISTLRVSNFFFVPEKYKLQFFLSLFLTHLKNKDDISSGRRRPSRPQLI